MQAVASVEDQEGRIGRVESDVPSSVKTTGFPWVLPISNDEQKPVVDSCSSQFLRVGHEYRGGASRAEDRRPGRAGRRRDGKGGGGSISWIVDRGCR